MKEKLSANFLMAGSRPLLVGASRSDPPFTSLKKKKNKEKVFNSGKLELGLQHSKTHQKVPDFFRARICLRRLLPVAVFLCHAELVAKYMISS